MSRFLRVLCDEDFDRKAREERPQRTQRHHFRPDPFFLAPFASCFGVLCGEALCSQRPHSRPEVSSLRLAPVSSPQKTNKDLCFPFTPKIDRTQRLLRRLEQDAPLLATRVAGLSQHQKSAKDYAERLTAHARAELQRLIQEQPFWDYNDSTPQAAD